MIRRIASALFASSLWIFAAACGGHNYTTGGVSGQKAANDTAAAATASLFHCSGVASPVSATLPVHSDYSPVVNAVTASVAVTFTCNAAAMIVGSPTATNGSFAAYTLGTGTVSTTGTFSAHGVQKVSMQFSERARPDNIVTAVALVNVAPQADTLGCTASVVPKNSAAFVTTDAGAAGTLTNRDSDLFGISVTPTAGRSVKVVSIVLDDKTTGTLTVGTLPASATGQFSIASNKTTGFAGASGLVITLQDTTNPASTTKCRAPLLVQTDTTINTRCTLATTTTAVYTATDPVGLPVVVTGATPTLIDLNMTGKSGQNPTITAVTGPPGMVVKTTTTNKATIDLGPNLGQQAVAVKITNGNDVAYCGLMLNATGRTPESPVVNRLYSQTHKDHFLTTDTVGPDGTWGPEGKAFSVLPTKSAACNVEVTMCHLKSSATQHFISPDSGCEGEVVEKVMGYGCAFQAPSTSKVLRGESYDGLDHLSTIDSGDLATFLAQAAPSATTNKDQTIPYYVPGSFQPGKLLGP